MKILICGDSMGVGGAETHILSLATELARLGHSVTIAARRGELCRRLPGKVRFFDLKIGCTEGFFGLRSIIASGEFDIIHAHSRWTAFAVSIIRKSLCRVRLGFVVTAHALYKSHPIKNGLSAWGDATIAVSNDIGEMLTRRFALPQKAVTVIGNGISISDFPPTPKDNIGHKLLFVSRLDKDCSLGAELICRIMPGLNRRFPDITLTVAGGGDSLPQIRILARIINRRLGRCAVRVLGAVTDVSPLIADCDLAVGVSRFALEAMASERNVLLFGNEGGLGLMSRQNWSIAAKSNFTARGCGVKNGDFLKSEIITFFEMPQSARRDTAEFCRKMVVDGFSISSVTAETLAVYESVLHRPTLLLGGYYGFGNLGDETVRGVLEESIGSSMPRARLLTLARRVGRGGEVDRSSLTEVFSAMRSADVYVSGGGSLLQDSTSFRSLIYYCSLISLARLCGCRIAVIGGGIGPLNRRVSRGMARAALSKCDYISLRDEISLKVAKELIGNARRIRLSADPALSLSLPHSDGGRTLAVSLRHSGDPVTSALSISGMPQIFIAMDQDYDKGTAPADIYSGAELLRKCGCAVGSRLHFLIMALLCGVPFAPIGSDPKITAFSEMTLGLPAIDPSKFADARVLADEIERYLDICRLFYSNSGRDRFLAQQRALFGRDLKAFTAFCQKRT